MAKRIQPTNPIKNNDGRFRQQESLRLARERIRKYVPAGVSLVDELIRDRRKEAALEEDGF
jgi:hypothetical protein